jgi:hypothetical protein
MKLMTGTLTGRVGFEHPNRRALAPRRYTASLQLLASAALLLSTVVAVAVVSIGIARAGPLEAARSAEGSLAAVILFALIFAGWGGLTALMARHMPRRN